MPVSKAVGPPSCSRCGNLMLIAYIVHIVPDKPGSERRTHKCPVCGNIETVEIAGRAARA
jgi:hypothetical protein